MIHIYIQTNACCKFLVIFVIENTTNKLIDGMSNTLHFYKLKDAPNKVISNSGSRHLFLFFRYRRRILSYLSSNIFAFLLNPGHTVLPSFCQVFVGAPGYKIFVSVPDDGKRGP